MAATERKGLRVKRVKGGRHGISPPLPPPPPPPPPFVKNRIPSSLPVDGWWRIGGECTGRKNIWLRFGVCGGGKGREMGGRRDSLCQRECMRALASSAFRIGFFMPRRREIGDRSATAAAECGRSTLAWNSFLEKKKGWRAHRKLPLLLLIRGGGGVRASAQPFTLGLGPHSFG